MVNESFTSREVVLQERFGWTGLVVSDFSLHFGEVVDEAAQN